MDQRRMFPPPLTLKWPIVPILAILATIASGSELSALLAEADPQRCRDTFDPVLKKQCMRGEWEQKYYFDSESNECRLFWYDGCPGLTGSRNFFDSLLECQWLCEPGQTQNAICAEPFDEHLRDECEGTGNWRRHFYFDRIRRRCVPFWFDGCESTCRNHFPDEFSCTRNCENSAEKPPLPVQKLSSTPYVPAWRLISTTPATPKRHGQQRLANPAGFHPMRQHDYTRGMDTRKSQYYPATTTDHQQPTSPGNRPSYGPTRPAVSLFPATSSSPRSSAPSPEYSNQSPSHRSSPSASLSSASTLYLHYPSTLPVPTPTSSSEVPSPTMDYDGTGGTTTNPEDVEELMGCGRTNPCQNGGTCVLDVLLKMPICKCAVGFTNDFCTEKIDFDPCSANPCKNGATCSATAGPEHTDFDCFCARNFAGRHCELRPCDDNPCKNGGTCRTTRSQSLFFCVCPPNWGGNTCMISIPSSEEIAQDQAQLPDNVNFTQHLSSGRAEWIEELKRVTPMMPSSTRGTTANNSAIRLANSNNIVALSSSEEFAGPSPLSPSSTSALQRASSRRSKDQSEEGFSGTERIVGPQEMPTRTLKGATAAEGAENGVGSDRGRRRPWAAVIALIMVVVIIRIGVGGQWPSYGL